MGVYDRDYMRGEEPGPFRRPAAAPWSATVALLVVLGAIFLVQLLLPPRGGRWLETQCSLSLDGIMHGRIWQLATFQFLHDGWWHILFNGIALYSFGRFMESTLGRSRFLLLYFVSGVSGGILQLAASFFLRQDPLLAVVGASAGISGLLAAFILCYPDAKLLLFPIPVPVRAWTLLWVILPLSIIGTVYPFGRIAHAAHLGGLLAGGAYIRWIWRARRPQTPAWLNAVVSSARSKPHPEAASDDEDFIASEVDPILDKIAKEGIHSLTDKERKTLETARARMGGR